MTALLVGVLVLAVFLAFSQPGAPPHRIRGAFAGARELVEAFTFALTALPAPFECRAPLYPPVVGAALQAARLAGAPLSPDALTRLRTLSAAAELPR